MARAPARRESEDERDNQNSGSAGVVMVGGMDDIIPPGTEELNEVRDERDDRTAKIVPARPSPKGGDDDGEEAGDDTRRGARRDIEEDSRLAYDEGAGDELEERGQQSRRMRRNRSRRAAIDSRDAVITNLAQRVDQLTSALTSVGQNQMGLTINSVEGQLSAAQQALGLADSELEAAVTAGDGRKFREVQRLRDEAAARVFQLSGARNRLQAEAQAGRVPGAAPRVAPQAQPQGQQFGTRAQEFTETFMSRFSYFDPSGTDEDSMIIKGIDDAVAAEGYRPDTPLYWRTLEQRLAKRGFKPDHGSDDRDDSRDDRNDRDDRDDSRARDDRDDRDDRPQRSNSGGRPPTSSARGGQRGGQVRFKLHPMMVDHLRAEGLDGPDNSLSEEDKGRKHRLIDGWRTNERRAARGEFSKS